MKPRLSSVTITDFRSIRDTVTVPLDAPVVLLHGPNGSGKTSVLSAIELALTGEVPSLRRTDQNYRAHLVHRDADYAQVRLAIADAETKNGNTEISIRSNGTIEGDSLLEGDTARFFSERCYLAQSTLGRLLEIYQTAEVSEDSPLTRFVKDLLGLDQLDALVEGLHPVLDVRNLRRLAPDYMQAERTRDAASARLAEANEALEAKEVQLSGLEKSILDTVAFLAGPTAQPPRDTPPELEAWLGEESEEKELVDLSASKRDLAGIRQRATVAESRKRADDQVGAERREREAQEQVDMWWSNTGSWLETTIEQLRAIFPDLPSVASTDPSVAYDTALARVESEIGRCNAIVTEDDELVTKIERIGHSIRLSRARLVLIDEQMASISGSTADLSRALAALIPHIHSEECPICGRDFSEISPEEPLLQRASAHVARLTEQADRLQGLGKTRAEASKDLSQSEREMEDVVRRRLAQDARNRLKARVADLTGAKRRLDDMIESVKLGAGLMRSEAEARRRLAEARASDRTSLESRAAVTEMCASLSQAAVEEAESTVEAISRLEVYLDRREHELLERQARRRKALQLLQQHRSLESEVAQVKEAIAKDTAERERAVAAIADADAIRHRAKAVLSAAADTRTAVVGRVFNSSLNKVWRDLFVRLAPTEPYVPAFRLPRAASEAVTAQLETVHRDGGTGGAPGAMLSAGNLNTAALTLFFALHLSVEAQLRWLVLDDPVQSMDEVHISQFAALLRTFSKELGRQVIVAVHDRPLFEYLALELSPAFKGDRLITVELSRSSSGISVAEPHYRNWEPDRAIAA